MVNKTRESAKTERSIRYEFCFNYGFLGNEYGKRIDSLIQEKYGKYPVINAIGFDKKNRIIMGSNPFYTIAANEMVTRDGFKIASQEDISTLASFNPDFLGIELGKNYIDTTLILNANAKIQDYHAMSIVRQIKELKKLSKLEDLPYGLDLVDFQLVLDGSSPEGLSLKLSEEAEITHLPMCALISEGKLKIITPQGLSRAINGVPLNSNEIGTSMSESREEGRILICKHCYKTEFKN